MDFCHTGLTVTQAPDGSKHIRPVFKVTGLRMPTGMGSAQQVNPRREVETRLAIERANDFFRSLGELDERIRQAVAHIHQPMPRQHIVRLKP
jgi:hypothetical protein